MKKSLIIMGVICILLLSGCVSVQVKDSMDSIVNKDNYCVIAFGSPLLNIDINGEKLGSSTQQIYFFGGEKTFIYPPGEHRIVVQNKVTNDSGYTTTYETVIEQIFENQQHYYIYLVYNRATREWSVRLINETNPNVWSSSDNVHEANERRRNVEKALSKIK